MIWLLIVLFLSTIWLFLKHVYSYWERKKFPNVTPTIPFGNLKAAVFKEKSFGITIHDLYQSTTLPYIGIYLFFRPALLIRNAELVKDILTKNFNSFHDRGVYVSDKDPISETLFALQGKKWKTLRANLTPTFTSGKLKSMFAIIEQTGKAMQNHLESTIPDKGGVEIEMKDLLSKYALDIIGSVIFGMDVNSFLEPNNDFRVAAKNFQSSGFKANLSGMATFLCPKLVELFPFLRQSSDIENFTIGIVKRTIEFREKHNYSRKDFMQLLLQLRNTGEVGIDGMWDIKTMSSDPNDNLKTMSIEQCAAQVFLFWIAGFETSSSTSSFCMYELTQNPDIMEKAIQDIDDALQKHNGQLTYDCLRDMKYLDLCIMETMRKYPGLPLLNRECTEDFSIPGTDHVIEKGTPIIISLIGLHRDPNYFRDPLKFDPERFCPQTKNYNEIAYIPFGDGPRACIGIRLGKINVKMAIVMLLTKFKFEAISKKEIEFDNYSLPLIAKGGVPVKIFKKK